MSAIGVNAVRLYAFDAGRSHADFLDACARHGIFVIGTFELSASHYDLTTANGVADAAADLHAQLTELNRTAHAAVAMWLVGNELNLPSAGFLCDAEGSGSGGGGGGGSSCQFNGTGLRTQFGHVDQLCEIVRRYGLLCSTALAEYPLPPSYDAAAAASREGSTAWFAALDGFMRHIDVWTANVYRAGGFGDYFYAARARTARPVVIGEYGVDAFDSGWGPPSECAFPPCRRMRESGAAQAVMVHRLTEQLERNAVTCVFNCESHVASGGFVFSWVDEWCTPSP